MTDDRDWNSGDGPADPRDIWPLLDRLLDLDAEAETAGSVAPHILEGALGIESPAAPPARWGAFRRIHELGRGGSSQVHLARRDDGQFEQQVAIKVLRAEIDDEAARRRLTRERAILARMDHPGIARLIDGGVGEDGRPWFAMEFVEGDSITTYAGRRHLSLGERLRLFHDLCAAVQYLHRHLVVHRDLKPGNILVTRSGEIRLLDLGISKILETEAAGRPDGALTLPALTPAWAAPEQILGQPTTTAVDLYSLGIILYELVTGRSPFPAGRFSAEDPSQSGLLQPAAPARLGNDLDAVLARALALSPADRYSSVEAFADDLRRFESGRPVAARADDWRYRLSRSMRRHRWVYAALAALVVSIATGFLATLWQAREARLAADRARGVSEFLVRLFETTDPDLESEAPMSARMLLDRGAAHIRNELADQPALRARLLQILGNLYGKLGDYPAADARLAEAWQIESALPGSTLNDRASILNDRGEVALALGATAQAESLHREALGRLERTFRADPLTVARARHLLASALRVRGALGPADSLARLALATRRRELPAGDLDIAHSLNDLAVIAFDRGRYEEAEPLFKESLVLYEANRELGQLRAEALRSNLAVLMTQQGRFAEAEPLFRTALTAQQARLGPDHPRVAHTLQGLAGDLVRLNRHAEAESLFRQTLQIHRMTRGDRHPEVAKTLHDLGQVLQGRGNFDAADSALAECRTILEAALGPDHAYVGKTLSAIGDLERERGRYERARTAYERSVRILTAGLGPVHDLTAAAHLGLGRTLLSAGYPADATPHLDAAAAAFTQLFGPDDRRSRAAREYVEATRAAATSRP